MCPIALDRRWTCGLTKNGWNLPSERGCAHVSGGACAILRGMGTNVLYTLLGGLAAGIAGIVVTLFGETLRAFRARPRLRLRTRVFWRGNDSTGVRLVDKYVPEISDRFDIQIVNPTPRRVMVAAVGFSFVNKNPFWRGLRDLLRGRVHFASTSRWQRCRWLLRLLVRRRLRDRVDFDVTHTDMPTPAQPESVATVSQTMSRLLTRCTEVGKKLSDVEEVWVETIDGKRFEAPVGEDVYWTLESMDRR